MASIDAHREHVREITRLKLWRVWWLTRNEGLDTEAAVRLCDFLGPTVFAGDRVLGIPGNPEGWRPVREELLARCARHRADESSEAMERAGTDLLWPHTEPALERQLAHAAAWLESSVGGFSYGFHPFIHAPAGTEEHLTLHVRNAYQPDSMFQHVPEVIGSLLEVIARSQRERPDVARAQCGTWINDLPPFSRLFPPSWIQNAEPGAPAPHTGWWGQFMDRRGGFHAKNGASFRRAGRFPFAYLVCRCAIGEWREHLQRLRAASA
ncbi:MAG: hypothetical protein HY321_06155 [Armatimonadetes bacterium]|nr:hypothetical protein [Armatimonadota bacterium]